MSLLLWSKPGWAGPPNPTPSDFQGNTAGGTNALSQNTPGSTNTAFGVNALFSNIGDVDQIYGYDNTAIGAYALYSNYKSSGNTASGSGALYSNYTGTEDTASGVSALGSNNTGYENTASGALALLFNTSGSYNTASGADALYSNNGDNNTASGADALYYNNTGTENTASGFYALYNNVSGSYNTAIGTGALLNTTGDGNTAVGWGALDLNTGGSYNTAIGFSTNVNAGTYTNGIALGYAAQLTASNSIVLGNNSITNIYANVTSISGISDRRHKKDIRPLDTDLGLDFIEKIEPVSYHFNNGDETERYGFIAQDLEQALPARLRDTIERSEPEHGLALIERQNDQDRTYRASYGELFAPIVKSIQQQQQEITELRQQNAELRRALADQAEVFKAENDALRHLIETLKEHVIAAR
jgi:hypothetical protein